MPTKSQRFNLRKNHQNPESVCPQKSSFPIISHLVDQDAYRFLYEKGEWNRVLLYHGRKFTDECQLLRGDCTQPENPVLSICVKEHGTENTQNRWEDHYGDSRLYVPLMFEKNMGNRKTMEKYGNLSETENNHHMDIGRC